jgi:hypothetical protein
MDDLIYRLIQKAPKSFKPATFSVPTDKPYYKITLKAHEVEHDGYCSGADDDDCQTTDLKVVCYLKSVDGIEKGEEWFYNLSCSGSGYCPFSCVAVVDTIEYIS